MVWSQCAANVIEANSGQTFEGKHRRSDQSSHRPLRGPPSARIEFLHENFCAGTFGNFTNDFTSEVYKITPSGQKRTVAGQDNRALFCGLSRGDPDYLTTSEKDLFS